MEIIWKTIQLSCLFFSFAEFFVQDKRESRIAESIK